MKKFYLDSNNVLHTPDGCVVPNFVCLHVGNSACLLAVKTIENGKPTDIRVMTDNHVKISGKLYPVVDTFVRMTTEKTEGDLTEYLLIHVTQLN